VAEDRKGLTTSSGRDSPVSSADDTAVEASLRQAFAESAPETLPTIGVRERIVERLRVRRRRRQRVVISVAGSCVLVVGVLVGALAVHPSGPSSRESAAPSMASAGAGARSVSKASGGAPKSLSVNCPSVFVGPPSGARRCFGTFSDPATAYDSPVFSPEASGTAVFGSSREANGADKLNTQKAGGAGGTTGSPLLAAPISPASPAIVVPVGRTVTIDLRGDVRSGAWAGNDRFRCAAAVRFGRQARRDLCNDLPLGAAGHGRRDRHRALRLRQLRDRLRITHQGVVSRPRISKDMIPALS